MTRHGTGRAAGTAATWGLVLALTLGGAGGAGALDVTSVTRENGLPSNWVTAVVFAPDGGLWVGTGDSGVALLDPSGAVVKRHRAADGLAADAVSSIVVFQGKVYVGTAAGLSVLDGASWSTLASAAGVTMRNVRLAVSPDGKELWGCAVYLNGGTVRFDGKTWAFMGGEGRGLFNDVQSFGFLSDGVLMASSSGVPYLHQGKEVLALSAGLPPCSIYAASALRGKGLIGTSRGLFEFDRSWKSITIPGASARMSVFALAEAAGQAYAGTSIGLFRYDGRQAAPFPGTGLPDDHILAVAAADGKVAVGTAKGLALLRGW